MSKSKLAAVGILVCITAGIIVMIAVAGQGVRSAISVVWFGIAAYFYAQWTKRDQRESDDALRYGAIAHSLGFNALLSMSGVIDSSDLWLLYGLGSTIILFDAVFFLYKRQYALHYWLTKRTKSGS